MIDLYADARDRAAVLARAQARWPMGSMWRTRTGRPVTVIGYNMSASPPDSYCGVTYDCTPKIHDGVREWSCLAGDLTPA